MKEYITMQRTLKKTPLVLPLLFLLLTFGLAACGASSATSSASLATATPNVPANEVDMNSYQFLQKSRTIRAGDHIHFVVEQGAEPHLLCLGQDRNCDASATDPKDLTGQGLVLNPGESHDVQFDKVGTYQITCTFHPSMHLVVTVR
jgi:plastocyanin